MRRKSPVITIGLSPAWDVTCFGRNLDWDLHQDIDEQSIRPAGKALNVSKALAWMGQQNIAAGLWGRDDYQLLAMAAQKMWRTFFSDLAIRPELTSVEGNVVHITSHISGTNTGDLDLQALGMGSFAATGRSVFLSVPVKMVAEGNKITSSWSDPGEKGGIHRILAQLGIELP